MIAITTDNGANIVKMVDVTNQIITIENTHQAQSHRECNEENSCDDDIEAYLQNVPDYDDQHALNILLEDSDNDIDDDAVAGNDIILNSMVFSLQNLNEYNFTELATGIRCAEHTLQLGIQDALSKISRSIVNMISLCRRIAKSMRLKSTTHELNSVGIQFSVPHLDVATRWCSTYVMVSICFIHFTVRFTINL